MNHITYNREQAIIENYFKGFSSDLQEIYEEKGKYLFLGNVSHLMISIMVLSLFVFFLVADNLKQALGVFFIIILELKIFTRLTLYHDEITSKK